MIKMNKKNMIELARIVADISGDGHLQLSKRRGVVSFYSKDMRKIKDIDQRFHRLFGIKGHSRSFKIRFGSKTLGIFFASKKLANFLAGIGVPIGNKTSVSYEVPKWISDGHFEVKKAFLRAFYDGEGSIYGTTNKRTGQHRWRIELSQYKSMRLRRAGRRYMQQIREMVEELGVKCSPVRFATIGKLRKDGTKSICIRFDIEKNSFILFLKNIGFNDLTKRNKLLRALRNYAGVA